MVSSAKGYDKLASGIAYYIRHSRHFGCRETTEYLWKALHSLSADRVSSPRPVLSLFNALGMEAGSQPSSAVNPTPAEDTAVTRAEVGTQTIEFVVTESEWKLQTEQLVKMTVDMTIAQTVAPVKTLMDQLQELQRQSAPSAPASGGSEADSSQLLQPTSEERPENFACDPMVPEPSPSHSHRGVISGFTPLGHNSIEMDRARQKEERRKTRKAALLDASRRK